MDDKAGRIKDLPSMSLEGKEGVALATLHFRAVHAAQEVEKYKLELLKSRDMDPAKFRINLQDACIEEVESDA